MPVTDLRALSGEDFCYLTTKGRVTGMPHEIEIWFALVPERRALYMLSGGRGRSDWVKNLRRDPDVEVSIAGEHYSGRAGCWSRSTRAIPDVWRTGAAARCPWW